MHHTCRDFLATTIGLLARTRPDGLRVAEVGSRDVNGTSRDLWWPDVEYVGVDIAEGPGVDVVADARELTVEDVGGAVDIVVCTNVLEHVADWERIIDGCRRVLAPWGALVLMAAGPGFAEHSGVVEGPLQSGEHYRNIEPDELEVALRAAGFVSITVSVRTLWPHDIYALAVL